MTAVGEGLTTPREVHIETTRACNLRCVQCAVSQPYYAVETLSFAAFERVLPFLRAHQPFVHLNGHGETLLHARFVEIFEAVIHAGCALGFQTNGTLLEPELCGSLLDHGRPGGFSSIRLSIDAAEPQLFERIRRRASFEAFIRNARFLGEERRRRELVYPTLQYEIVAMALNLDQLPAVVRLVAELGADELCVSDLIEYPGFEGQRLEHQPERAREVLLEARELAAALSLKLSIVPALEALLAPTVEPLEAQASPGDEPAPAEPPSPMVKDCRDPWEVVFVQASGEVMPCCFLPMPMGNVNERPLEEIWRSAQYETLRQLVASTTPLPPCASCFVRGWKPTEAPACGLTDDVAQPGEALELAVAIDRGALGPGERARVTISVRPRPGGRYLPVDVLLRVDLPDGGQIWLDCNGLTDRRGPLLGAWQPALIEDFCVFWDRFPELACSGEVTLTLLAVAPGAHPWFPFVRVGRAVTRFHLESPDDPSARSTE